MNQKEYTRKPNYSNRLFFGSSSFQVDLSKFCMGAAIR